MARKTRVRRVKRVKRVRRVKTTRRGRRLRGGGGLDDILHNLEGMKKNAVEKVTAGATELNQKLTDLKEKVTTAIS